MDDCTLKLMQKQIKRLKKMYTSKTPNILPGDALSSNALESETRFSSDG